MTERQLSVSRRRMLQGSLAAAAVPVLASCGADDASNTPMPTPEGSESKKPDAVSVSAADVPVGGGVIQGTAVITQPTAGTYKAFTSKCTHEGCTVNRVADNVIHCPCHGSAFSAEDGAVANGPATRPLEEFPTTVSGDKIIVG